MLISQIANSPELLNRIQILGHLSEFTKTQLSQLVILDVVDSTNRYALENFQGLGISACLAEFQTAGRGRQGRQWVSPDAGGICLSLKQTYRDLPFPIGGVSIASAVSVVKVLQALGASEVGVKWPNDIIWQGRKLGGLLLESRTTGNLWEMVVGIGINVNLSNDSGVQSVALSIDQPWVDLYDVLGYPISRNRLAAQLIEQEVQTLADYSHNGLRAFMDDWQQFDKIYGQPVILKMPSAKSETQPEIEGVACGIDEEGALLLRIGHRLERFVYGEVSVRKR